MIIRFIIWYMSRLYKKGGWPLYEINGTGEDYPKYLLYTENERCRDKMRNI